MKPTTSRADILKQQETESLKRAYARYNAHPTTPTVPSPIHVDSPPIPPSIACSSTTKPRKHTKMIQTIELEFVFQNLGVVSKALSLWKKDKVPIDVYFKFRWLDGSIKKVSTGPEVDYESQILIQEPVESYFIFQNNGEYYSKFYKKVRTYRKQVTYKQDPNLGSSFLVKWCRSQFSDFQNVSIIHQPHHFILNLLNFFHLIANHKTRTPLLNLAENISLEDFYNTCRDIFVQESV